MINRILKKQITECARHADRIEKFKIRDYGNRHAKENVKMSIWYAPMGFE